MNVEFLMAARGRIVYDGRTTLAAALLDKQDDDPLVQQIEEAYAIHKGDNVRSALDTLEVLIATRVDDGENLPISNPEGYGAARWLSQTDLANLPDPVPRSFVLYLARAWAEAGKYPTTEAAITDILATRSFV